MTIGRQRVVGWALIALGICVVAFSEKIVFPGLESLLGIETIVGKQNVKYLDGGGYVFTNPGAMARWVISVAAVGVLAIGIGGTVIFRTWRLKGQ